MIVSLLGAIWAIGVSLGALHCEVFLSDFFCGSYFLSNDCYSFGSHFLRSAALPDFTVEMLATSLIRKQQLIVQNNKVIDEIHCTIEKGSKLFARELVRLADEMRFRRYDVVVLLLALCSFLVTAISAEAEVERIFMEGFTAVADSLVVFGFECSSFELVVKPSDVKFQLFGVEMFLEFLGMIGEKKKLVVVSNSL